MESLKIILTEPQFSHLCKLGFITRKDENLNSIDIYFNRIDIKDLVDGKIVSKDCNGSQIEFVVLRIEREQLIEIVKRSPVFYELINTL
jgi:hypothetical protein